jgi:hypothetical protein
VLASWAGSEEAEKYHREVRNDHQQLRQPMMKELMDL